MNKQGVTCWLGSEGKAGPEIHCPNEIADNGYPKHANPVQFYVCRDARRDSCPYAFGINAETDELSFSQTLCLYGLRQKKGS
jgi:hypothetical protein